jgi:hypothetical protein
MPAPRKGHSYERRSHVSTFPDVAHLIKEKLFMAQCSANSAARNANRKSRKGVNQ